MSGTTGNGMSRLTKLEILGQSAKYDICSSSFMGGRNRFARDNAVGNAPPGCAHSTLPDGRIVCMFKVLLTNSCNNDCRYCLNRSSRDAARARFGPEELTRLFLEFYRRNYVSGLFLSSGVCGSSDATMEKMIDVAHALRHEHNFAGYIHLKVLPGAGYELVKRAAELANRVSVNLEAPSASRAAELSSQKDYKSDLLKRMGWIKRFIKRGGAQSGQTTQFVVGASDESDKEILRMDDWLYRNMELKKGYFSAFQPVKKTPLEKKSGTPLLREHRLYQSDYLLRVYKFKLRDFVFEEDGNLNLKFDPKFMMALENREYFPLDVNEAGYHELLRVPGIGPRSARRILSLRGKYRVEKVRELRNLGVVVRRAKPFIKLDGRVQGRIEDYVR